MSVATFQPGDRVRLVDARAAVSSKRRPGMPADVDLVVHRVVEQGRALSIHGYAGYWRSERFERAG